ncbi:MauE/DoxX family redox-associated membrane protein [Loktanella agnita]|uniref:MauE/DoxX family redox-associated membrane protein n=1 Tax=Loktanella agnita TaxID=287097 RepID=UPI003987A18C
MTIATDNPETAAAHSTAAGKTASLYRMDMPGHLCPFGLKSRALLRLKGYEIDDNLLTSREEVDAFVAKHDVKTTPQTFINGKRIGGFEALKTHFGYTVRQEGETSYQPVIAIYAAAALIALAVLVNFAASHGLFAGLKIMFAMSMVLLAVQKLRDVDGFVNSFLGYDLLARRWVPYGYAYPFLELYAGVGMLALIGQGSALIWLVAPVALMIGAIGAISVIKAVYIEKRALTCACVGGGSQVPLGFVSLTENLVMVGMALWMLGAFLTG